MILIRPSPAGGDTVRWTAVLVLCAACLSCGRTPTSPDLERVYWLEVAASPSCPTNKPGYVLAGRFRLQLARTEGRRDGVLQLPSGPSYSGPNSGDIELMLTRDGEAVTGTLEGHGLAADGSHSVAIGTTATSPPFSRAAPLVGSGRVENGTLSGTFSGYLAVSIYQYNYSESCAATDHFWWLTGG